MFGYVELNAVGFRRKINFLQKYPRNYTGAFILGNLLAAILVRNELFGRFLYLFVNTLFAKVCRSRPLWYLSLTLSCSVDPIVVATWLYIG